jgi:hypothetical protein
VTALIIGASSGVGRHLAELFARDGYDLVLVARRATALERRSAQLRGTHNGSARVVAADASGADAGFGVQGRFASLPLVRQLQMIQVNVAALTDCDGWKRGTVLVIPGLANRPGVFSVRLGPRALGRTIAKRVNSHQPE